MTASLDRCESPWGWWLTFGAGRFRREPAIQRVWSHVVVVEPPVLDHGAS
jgi:hypothetical protein